MGYFNELTFASGYYHIDAHGVVTLAPDTPPEVRERFWKVWPAFRKKVIALEKQGIYSSAYRRTRPQSEPVQEPVAADGTKAFRLVAATNACEKSRAFLFAPSPAPA